MSFRLYQEEFAALGNRMSSVVCPEDMEAMKCKIAADTGREAPYGTNTG